MPSADRRTQPDRRGLGREGGRRATDVTPDWLSVGLWAKRYGVDRRTVRKWIACRLLDTYRVGALVRVRNLPPDEHRQRLTAEQN